jgi:two-component system chemotaxis sensor kinase CheA
VVDDDECVRELLYLHLSNAGYNVLLAEDAIAAGYLLLERRVDLLLTDIEMPFMSGVELVQALRNDPSVSSLPVAFLTSYGEHEDKAKELGAIAFLKKAACATEVLAAIAGRVKGPPPIAA